MALSFSGSVRLQDMPGAHAQLSAALTRPDPIEIDFSAIEEAPVALAQLVEAARLSAARDGKALRVAGLSPAMRAMLERAGFCGPGVATHAFWTSEAG